MYSHSTERTAQMTCVLWLKGFCAPKKVIHPLLHPVFLSPSSPNPDLLSTYPSIHCEGPRQDGTSTEYPSSTVLLLLQLFLLLLLVLLLLLLLFFYCFYWCFALLVALLLLSRLLLLLFFAAAFCCCFCCSCCCFCCFCCCFCCFCRCFWRLCYVAATFFFGPFSFFFLELFFTRTCVQKSFLTPKKPCSRRDGCGSVGPPVDILCATKPHCEPRGGVGEKPRCLDFSGQPCCRCLSHGDANLWHRRPRRV